MLKKYKFKKKRKIIGPYCIFIIFAVFLLFVSYGYSFLKDSLNINGKATFLCSDIKDYGNSTYTWSLYAEWPGPDNTHFYQVEIPINNFDGDITSWEVSFDVPLGCTATTQNLWQASEVTINNNTVTLKAQNWNSYVKNGSQLSLNLILPFTSAVDFSISNVSLNGKYVNFTSNI